MKEIKGHNNAVYSLSYDKNLKVLASGSVDKTIKI